MLTLDSTTKNPDDVVITLAIRTPLTKAGKGGFKDTPLDFLVYSLLKKVLHAHWFLWGFLTLPGPR